MSDPASKKSSSSTSAVGGASALSPNGQHLVSCLRRNQFRVLKDGKAVFSHTDAKEAYNDVKWFRFGSRDVIAFTCVSGNLQIWNFTSATTELLGTVEGV